MPENMNHVSDLESRAAAVLDRAKQTHPTFDEDKSTRTPIGEAHESIDVDSIQQSHSDYDAIPAPPTAEEMAHAGMTTSDELTSSKMVTSDDDAVILSGSTETTKPLTEEDETVILTSIATEHLGNVDPADRDAFIAGIMPEIASFKKDLIINQGMTAAEAAKAAENRVKRTSDEYAENWAKEHPEGVILTIDKSQEEDLKLDDDTMAKVRKAKLIKLVAVEAQELKTLNVKPLNKADTKMSLIRNLCDSISRYSVPLLMKGDYAFFNGAQSGVLANATSDDDDDVLDSLEKKATLLYHCFGGSVTQSKRKPDGKEMSYEEFCNWFLYDDIDMGIYAIVTASTMEESESTYICQNPNCNKAFQITYNNKTLLDLSELSDMMKDRLKEIDEHRSSYDYISALVNRCAEEERFKSPFSENIYQIGSTSIAEVRHRLSKVMDMMENVTQWNMACLMYVNKFWIHDKSDNSYIEVDVHEDPAAAFDLILHLHQVDMELLGRQLYGKHYSPSFKIHVKCPHCGRDAVDNLGIDSMIFLHARALLTEIQ